MANIDIQLTNQGQVMQAFAGGTAQMGQWEFDLTAVANYESAMLDELVAFGCQGIMISLAPGMKLATDYFAQVLPPTPTLAYNSSSVQVAPTSPNWTTDYSRLRADVSPHWTLPDSTIDQMVTPMRTRLAAQGETAFIIVQSGIGNKTITWGGTFGATELQQFADFVTAFFTHCFATYGWVPDAINVVNEPDLASPWSAAEVGSMCASLWTTLRAAGFSPYIVAPSVWNIDNLASYWNTIKATAGVQDIIDHGKLCISFHEYTGDLAAGRTFALGRITAGETPFALMTEHVQSHLWDKWWADHRLGGVAWTQLQGLAFGAQNASLTSEGVYVKVDWTDVNNPVLLIPTAATYIKQVAKYVRRGAVKVGTVNNHGALDGMAFRNRNGRHVVAVHSVSAQANFTVGPLPPATYGIQYTTASIQMDDLPDVVLSVQGNITTSIPAAGVLTIYDKSTSTLDAGTRRARSLLD